jgi:hypothetical protein
MRYLIAILMSLLLGPAMAQELVPPAPVPMETGNIIYTTLNPPPEGTQFNWNGFINLNTDGGGILGGNIPAYNSQTGTFIWGFLQGTVTYNFYGNSFWPNDDSMVNGFKYSWEYFNQDFSRGSLTGNISFYGNGNNLLESYNFAFPQTTEGWTILSGQIDFETPYDRSQVGRLQLSFTGKDDRFWLGYYGPQIRDLDVSILYSEITEPIAPDCTINPNDPTCIIQDLTDFTDEEILATTEPDTGDDGSDDGSEPIVEDDEEEEAYVADETVDETDLEETLQDEETSSDEEVVVAEANEREVAYRELTDEEKAQILADSISKNTLESALSIAETSIASTVISTTETTVTSSSRTNTSNETETKDEEEKSETLEEQLADSGSETANDLLENGRSLNAASLAQTQTQTEQSASDSILQAESIATSSSETRGSDTIIESISIENVLDNSSVANSGGSDSETTIEPTVSTTETIVEEVLVSNIEQSIETSTETVDSFNDIMNIEIKPTDTTSDDVEFVQNVLAQTEQKSEENISAFEEDEKVTIQNDPNLANAFNVVPNTTNLELAGVLGNNKDEKSDAEKRAEEVVAANKEQQDEINKNYMDADQSGIVAAMGSDTDVSSYRSAMLNDNNIWYKPEDIYKNVVYKDNVRGAYFLEKGNTDTYKKMVEEQYK